MLACVMWGLCNHIYLVIVRSAIIDNDKHAINIIILVAENQLITYFVGEVNELKELSTIMFQERF